MDERFVPLATYLRVARPPLDGGTADASEAANVAVEARPASLNFAHADIVHDLTMLRIAASEAFERAARHAIDVLAGDVLCRELTIAPADIDALVARALAAFAAHEPLSIAVSGVDYDRVRAPLPVASDPSLAAGDLVVYVRDGAFESRFDFRLCDALERARAGRCG